MRVPILKAKTVAIALALAVALTACGSEDSATAADDGNAKPANSERAPTVGKEIADDFNSSMDRAKNVENQVMQQKQDIDKALKEAEGET